MLAAARHTIEQVIFTSRWLLAPIYAGLSMGLLVLLLRFAISTVELVSKVLVTDTAQTIVGVLGLVDLALMGSLVPIVIFSGYENFVAGLNAGNRNDKRTKGFCGAQPPQKPCWTNAGVGVALWRFHSERMVSMLKMLAQAARILALG